MILFDLSIFPVIATLAVTAEAATGKDGDEATVRDRDNGVMTGVGISASINTVFINSIVGGIAAGNRKGINPKNAVLCAFKIS